MRQIPCTVLCCSVANTLVVPRARWVFSMRCCLHVKLFLVLLSVTPNLGVHGLCPALRGSFDVKQLSHSSLMMCVGARCDLTSIAEPGTEERGSTCSKSVHLVSALECPRRIPLALTYASMSALIKLISMHTAGWMLFDDTSRARRGRGNEAASLQVLLRTRFSTMPGCFRCKGT